MGMQVPALMKERVHDMSQAQNMDAAIPGVFSMGADTSFTRTVAGTSPSGICQRIAASTPRSAWELAVRTIGDNRAKMSNSCEPDETDNLPSMESYREMESRLNCLRSLVCDLLKTNQELRSAVVDAKLDARSDASLPPETRPQHRGLNSAASVQSEAGLHAKMTG